MHLQIKNIHSDGLALIGICRVSVCNPSIFLLKFFKIFKEDCCSHLFDLRDIIQPITEIMTMGIDRIPEKATNQDHQEKPQLWRLVRQGAEASQYTKFCEPLYFPDQSSNLLQDLLDLSGGM
jgi:hypothetical protein